MNAVPLLPFVLNLSKHSPFVSTALSPLEEEKLSFDKLRTDGLCLVGQGR